MFVPLFLSLAFSIQIAAPGPEPAREPQLAVSGTTVGLTFGSGKSIYFASSTDGGSRFSKAVRVGDADVLPLNRHRGPRMAMFGNTIVITAVGGKKLAEGPHAHGLPSDGDLWAWRSTDGGKTWTQPVRVNDVSGAPTEGLHTLSSDGKGRMFAAWLDKRGSKGTALFGAISTDGGRSWSVNERIYESPEGTICECCHPSSVFGPDGSIQVMFRNWLGGSRDMYLAKSGDGVHFSPAEKLGKGTWKLNACPMDGGGLAVVKGQVVSAWRRDGEVFVARPGEAEKSLGRGIDVSLAVGENGFYAVWSTPNGVFLSAPGNAEPKAISANGGFPSIAALPGGKAVAAWEEGQQIRILQVR